MSRNLIGGKLALLLAIAAAGCSGGSSGERNSTNFQAVGGTNVGATSTMVVTTSPGSTATTSTPAGTTSGIPTRPVSTTPSGTTTPGSTTPGSTTPGTGTTTTTTPAGPKRTTIGPTIKISSPARATHTTNQAVKVEGTVTDQDGVAVLTVNGNVVQVGAGPTGGPWATVVTLNEGLNTIVVEGTNGIGQKSKQSLSVVYGEFAPDTQPIVDAMCLRLNQPTLDTVAKLASSKLGGSMLEQQIMARNPLYKNQLKALGLVIASAEVVAKKATFGNPSMSLTCKSGALEVKAEIPDVFIEVNAHDYGGIPYSITGHISSTRAIVDADCVVTIVNNQVVTSISRCDVTLENFTWGINGFPSLLTNLASSFVKNLLEDEVAKQVKTVVPPEVNKAIAGMTGAPFTQTIMGSQASFTVAPTFSSFDPQGWTMRANMNVQMQPVAGFIPPTAPGSLVTKGGAPTLGTVAGFYASINEDLMNRAGYAAWKAGVTQLTIDQNSAQALGMPAFITLDASILTTFIPELQGKIGNNDPIAFVLSPKLPPIFKAQPKPDTVEAGLGDFHLEIYDMAPGAAKKLIISIALHAKVKAGASVKTGNVVKVAVGSKPFIDVSIVDSPLAPDLNLLGLSNFVQFAVPPILQIVGNTWSGFPLPTYPGLTPKNLDIEADGAKKTFLTIKGDL